MGQNRPILGPKWLFFRPKFEFIFSPEKFPNFPKRSFFCFRGQNVRISPPIPPECPQIVILPPFQAVLRPFAPFNYYWRITPHQTPCTGSILATSCPQCTPRNCGAPQIAPQIWIFLPLGAFGGPFALSNFYLRMSTDQPLCASSTPATSYPSYTPHNFVAPSNCPPNLDLNNLFGPNHESYLSY